jgi:hypothetical protein
MTDHPMSLEYTANAYRSQLGGAFTSIEHSFETLAAARHALRLVGLLAAMEREYKGVNEKTNEPNKYYLRGHEAFALSAAKAA